MLEADQTAAFGTIPGGVYTLLEKYVLRSNTAVMGARYVKHRGKDIRRRLMVG